MTALSTANSPVQRWKSRPSFCVRGVGTRFTILRRASAAVPVHGGFLRFVARNPNTTNEQKLASVMEHGTWRTFQLCSERIFSSSWPVEMLTALICRFQHPGSIKVLQPRKITDGESLLPIEVEG